eukprot:SAG31_NODE_12_length_38498_cov_21.161671_15_plen_214_part_00
MLVPAASATAAGVTNHKKMFDRFGHGSITWDEIRILCGELAFSTLLPAMKDEAARARLYTKTSAGDESNGADGSGLTLNKLSRLLRSASVAQALEAESQHHTASYQYKVLEKCLQMLVSRHIDIYDISEARLAYNFHSHMFYGVSKSDKTAPPMSHLFCLLRRAMVKASRTLICSSIRRWCQICGRSHSSRKLSQPRCGSLAMPSRHHSFRLG